MNGPAPQNDHAPSLSLAELCLEIIQETQIMVEQHDSTQSSEAIVHHIRVLTKRLRAAWKLVPKSAARTLPSRRRRALRELSAAFGNARDRDVLLRLCGKLMRRKKATKSSRDALALMAEDLRNVPSAAADPPDWNWVREVLAEESAAWSSLTMEWDAKQLHKRFAKSRQKALALSERALANDAPEIWHDWRKALKQLRYQSEFLAALARRPLLPREIRVKRLASLLGQRNDCANLAEKLNQTRERLTSRQSQGALEIIRAEDSRLAEKCHALAAALDLPGKKSHGGAHRK